MTEQHAGENWYDSIHELSFAPSHTTFDPVKQDKGQTEIFF